jgi:hypothetical protein
VEVIGEDPTAAGTGADTVAEVATRAGTVPVEVTGTARDGRDGRGEISDQETYQAIDQLLFSFFSFFTFNLLINPVV